MFGVWMSRSMRLMRRDNGCAALQGQPAKAAFPKGFMTGLTRLSQAANQDRSVKFSSSTAD
jgi:hypothetical protein